ncbi:MAG: putative DNA modification/repair radical SAM protein [Oscillospiraceae bacterium]|nr:putative DNA modification/repair radical SAM protein [Oscillospiraceae bacterium]
MDIYEKLTILAEAAKYDASCSSSGNGRTADEGYIGASTPAGCCHSFSADGRCISLLKVLMSNACVYDCKYCLSRRSNDFPRATFTPRELADLTIEFYRRNYIEGLFLSSAVVGTPDWTTEHMIEVLRILREEYGFAGYIHAKAIPGADPVLTHRLGLLADRLSVNIELPSEQSLVSLAPDKTKHNILEPMGLIKTGILENREDITKYRHAPKFVPAGQSTQMIVGASPETDYHILHLTESLYKKFGLKRVYYSAYVPLQEDALLPSIDTRPPLLREHRLYQADWLLRFYGFEASEIIDPKRPMLHPEVDPKCSWAVSHLDDFPVEVNTADYEMLLRVPGIGVKGAKRILAARRYQKLDFDILKRLGVVLKRAKWFITCSGKTLQRIPDTPEMMIWSILSPNRMGGFTDYGMEQLSLFETVLTGEDVRECLTGEF